MQEPKQDPVSEEDWNALITDAIKTADPLVSNFKITRCHYLLSAALFEAVGPEAGANFHSWAIWGSRKAGVTIRQEDKDQASRDATMVAGIVGTIVGIVVGKLSAVDLHWSLGWSVAAWSVVGSVVGGYCGYLLAQYTRGRASSIILEGNRIVVDDIGRETARYLEYVRELPPAGSDDVGFSKFLAGFREGPSEQGGQTLLKRAFEHYEKARRTTNTKFRHECNYFANCLAVLHEHIRLQPYISKSLPFLIRKCVTKRLMTYSVGNEIMSVHEEVPPLGDDNFPLTLSTIELAELNEFLNGHNGWDLAAGKLTNTRTTDWTKIRERMSYIVNLFRTRHLVPDLLHSPYNAAQLEAIARGKMPERPW